MKVSFVWAEDEAGWIGKNGQLPWHLPADLKHFKAVTMHHPVVMGAKTYYSIGRPLPHRDNIVVSHQQIDQAGVETVTSIQDLKRLLAKRYGDQEVCIIGGAGLFSQTADIVKILHRTVVEGDHQGDVKMVPIDYHQWHLDKKTVVPATKTTVPNCRFEEWSLNKEKY
ncbi:dihydrofolate reductase [Limosilactobacillus caecicola]|uniref:dihydrofolate reductase n=1 Tax=Limosilactobacillus caecicola TaxID=2941332 RepID=UPI0020404BE3|nr:dihydrofolate reductase [Limosilactobacillus caecicola]